MRPIALTIKGFGSFTKKQTLTFPTAPGLYFMSGINEAEPALEGNGTGKTTVWKALTWCIFGKDPRGLKAGDVANWSDPKGAYVAFAFEVIEGNTWMGYTVERTHSPNSWKLYNALGDDGIDLTKETENPLFAMLRLEFVTWLNCVLMAQGEPMFLDMKPEPKAALFSDVMGLDEYLFYSGRAAAMRDGAENKLIGLERDISTLRGRLESLKDSDLSDMKAEWEGQRERRLKGVTDLYADRLAQADNLKSTLKTTEDSMPAFEERMRKELDAREAAGKRFREMDDVCQTSEDRYKIAEHDEAQARAHLGEFADAVCPTCGASGDHLVQARERADVKVIQATRYKKQLYGIMMADKDRLVPIGKAVTDAVERVRNATEARDTCDGTIRSLRRSYEGNERELDALEEDGERIKAEVNPYAESERRRTENRRSILEDLELSTASADVVAERAAKLGFWVRGFKDVRLRLIAEALEELAIEVNSCVTGVGLAKWELVFEVDRETKGGTISRGFTVYVRSPHNDRPVPWDSWSGGEAQRLRVAAQMGLADQIRSQTGATIPLEVWDEPTVGMSPRGISDLLDTLSIRARDEQRVIFVVDHTLLGYGGFDGVVTVIKDKHGSRIEQ